ncbi:GrpB family protein [Halovivax sp.]|uniref:GrpB family protein n=1 Tax=Halovivax sp. TaxID=1935978 RepID=UPI0025B99051|nr:GrpB family protein [Halovivax sp.]
MVGLERGTIELVSDRREWVEAYEAEVDRLHSLLGDRVIEFDHVGSTAVEGRTAKPIVDVCGLVESLDAARELIPILEDHGYEHRPTDDVDDRVFLANGPRSRRTHHLSLTTPNSDTHREQLAFRDYLRANPDVATEYEELKRELAERYPNDRARYTEEKSAFVGSALERAPDQ